MTQEQARTVKVGDRIRWRDFDPAVHNEADLGTVIEREYGGFKVRWDDGLEISYPFAHASTLIKVHA